MIRTGRRFRTPAEIEANFWENVQKTDSCWLWIGATAKGYGAMRYGGRQMGAHVYSHILQKGPVPPGLFVCHHCDVRNCVNPAHLFLGTAKDNMQDCKTKGRLVAPPANLHLKGEKHPAAKLTEKDVAEIRDAGTHARRRSGIRKGLSEKFGVTMTTITNICSGERWKG